MADSDERGFTPTVASLNDAVRLSGDAAEGMAGPEPELPHHWPQTL